MSPVIGYIAAGLIGLAITLVAVGLSRRTSPGVAALSRVGLGEGAVALPGPDRTPTLGARLGTLVSRRLPGRRTMTREETNRVRRRLDRAGLSMPAEAVMALKVAAIGAGLVLGLLITLLFGLSLVAGLATIVLLAVLAWLAPDLWVLNTAQRRQQQIDRAMPETLDLLALTAQAGLGLEQGMAEVAGELPGALGAELDRFLKEQQLGLSRQDALQGLMDRNSSEDLRTFALALLQAEKLGTPISRTLQVQAREMRRRRRARASERAGKAPVKLLFPLIFGIFPALFIIIMGPGALSIMEAFR